MKEVIMNQALVIEPKDNQTNIPLTFTLKKDYSKMVIRYQYGPSYASQEESYRLVKEALERYYPQNRNITESDIKNYLPIENLVTLSLSLNGDYLGARHTKERNQEVVISLHQSSLGFPKQSVSKGEWEIQLNVHCVVSEKIQAFITVTVEGEDDYASICSGVS